MDIPRPVIQKEIVCGLCDHVYNENTHLPKTLICKDVACVKCLKEMCKGAKRIKCPFCHKATLLSALGVPALPTDDAVIHMLHLVKEVDAIQTPCKEHADHPVNFACIECYKVLCAYCLASAVMKEEHAGHQIVYLEKAFEKILQESQSQAITIQEKKLVVEEIKGLSKETFKAKLEELMGECKAQADAAVANIRQWEESTERYLNDVLKNYREPTSEDEDDEMKNLLDNAEYVQHELLSVSVKARKKDLCVFGNYKDKHREAGEVIQHLDEYQANNKPKGPFAWMEGNVEAITGQVMIQPLDAQSPRKHSTVMDNRADDGKVYLIADEDSDVEDMNEES